MRRLRFAALVALLACDGAAPLGESPPEEPPAVRGGREQVLGPFLSAHWQLPVAPQGPVPQGFSEVDASLDPEVCGACHPLQLTEWQTSLHAAAFSPGFAGQLLEGNLARAPQLRACQRCHAPLSEQ